jgi:hypothetical protein
MIMAPPKPKKHGIWENSRTSGGSTSEDNLVDRVADFSYENDALAQLIVEIWLGQHGNLISPSGSTTTPAQYQTRSDAAKTTLAACGIYLAKPIVLTEVEYQNGFSLADAGLDTSSVVFVVPDTSRATTTSGAPPALLETAKMLMAVTPNGI